MATPTKTDLQTLDYSYFGQPYVQVAAKSGIDLDTLDYSYFGQPFFGTEAGGGDPPSSIINHIMHYRKLMSR